MSKLMEFNNEAPTFDWKRYPETEAFINDKIATALEGNAFAARLAERMARESSTRFGDWVDHLVIGETPGLGRTLRDLGYVRQETPYASGTPVFAHSGGMFPRIAVDHGPEVRDVAIKVESIASFSRTHDLGLNVLGYPLGPYRVGRIPGESTSLAVVERRGYVGFDPFSSDMARVGRITPQVGPRRPSGSQELWESPAATVRRRRRGVRRRPRSHPGPGHRAGGRPGPGVSPGLRGRARLLAIEEPRGPGPEGPPGPAGAGVGEPRPSHLSVVPTVLPPA